MLVGIRSEDWPDYRDDVWPFFLGFDNNGQIEPSTLEMDVIRRDRQCWAAYEGDQIKAVMLTQVREDKLNTVRMTHCAGSGRDDWVHFFPVIEEWAKSMGSKRLEALARPGWKRVFKDEMRASHVLLEKDL